MSKPTGIPQPQKRYKDAHGALVTVESVSHNRVTFYRDGYQSPCVQPLARFMKEIEAVTGAGTQLLEALASAGQPADGGPAHGPAKLRRMSGSRPVRTHFCAM